MPDAAEWKLELGATPRAAGGVRFCVWAPRARTLEIELPAPGDASFPLHPSGHGIWEATIAEASAGQDYYLRLDGERRLPDPVSRWQPAGVHGPSRIVAPDAFRWSDHGWRGHALEQLVIYELHVGTFTAAGTFDAVIPRLRALRALGITTLELMPVAEFPGARNWGYDGVHLYAPQSSYGGPAGLKRLVDACHGAGLSVLLDVVYNHLGPEGNVLPLLAPCFTDRARTPWGRAINYDGRGSHGVRRHVIDNARYWISEFHLDGLRLDAVGRIHDRSSPHLLTALTAACHAAARRRGRRCHVIAESDLNDARLLRPVAQGGLGLDAQWSDDFLWALRAALTGERRGHLVDFGGVAPIAKALERGFVLDGGHSICRGAGYGNPSGDRPGAQHVVFNQNHDQIANTGGGDRLAARLSPELNRCAAALLLCAPNVPLLFMGEEYGETAPFLYFTSHGDPALVRAVRRGRRREYAAYLGDRRFDDPQAPETHARSRIDWAQRGRGAQAATLRWYRELLRCRSRHPALIGCRKDLTRVGVAEHPAWLQVTREGPGGGRAVLLCNLSSIPVNVELGHGFLRRGPWSGDVTYGGTGALSPPARISGRLGASRCVVLGPEQVVLYLSP